MRLISGDHEAGIIEQEWGETITSQHFMCYTIGVNLYWEWICGALVVLLDCCQNSSNTWIVKLSNELKCPCSNKGTGLTFLHGEIGLISRPYFHWLYAIIFYLRLDPNYLQTSLKLVKFFFTICLEELLMVLVYIISN